MEGSTFYAIAHIEGGIWGGMLYTTREQAARAFAREVRECASTTEAESFVCRHGIIPLHVYQEPEQRLAK